MKTSFRSILYKNKLSLLPNNSFIFFLISGKEKLIEQNCINATRIVISRQFQHKKKSSKHQRFKFTMKITQKRKIKLFFSPFLIHRIKTKLLLKYKYKLLPLNNKILNKKRMNFKFSFNLPITKKSTRSRMGKGKGKIDKYLCHIYINTIIYKLYRISLLKKRYLERKLKLKLGNLIPKIK